MFRFYFSKYNARARIPTRYVNEQRCFCMYLWVCCVFFVLLCRCPTHVHGMCWTPAASRRRQTPHLLRANLICTHSHMGSSLGGTKSNKHYARVMDHLRRDARTSRLTLKFAFDLHATTFTFTFRHRCTRTGFQIGEQHTHKQTHTPPRIERADESEPPSVSERPEHKANNILPQSLRGERRTMPSFIS